MEDIETIKRNNKRIIWIIAFVIIIILVSIYAVTSLANDKTYTGEYIRANKVYMPNNNIKLVLYFNVSSEDITYTIFDNWDARHSIQLSNIAEGTNIKIHYKEYIIGGDCEIVRIELL